MHGIDCFYKVKNKLRLHYHGIDLSHVMIFELFETVSKKKAASKSAIKYSLFHCFDMSAMALPNNGLLTTFGRQNRKDHKEVYDYVWRRIHDFATYNDMNVMSDIRCFHPALIVIVISKVFVSLFFEKKMTFKEKAMLAADAVYYCNTIKSLETVSISGVKAYLSMYNATQLENLITQYMKKRDIPTYSLCEGVYFVEKDKLNIDSVNYTNLETDHLITWGQSVVDDFSKVGIPTTRMIVGGYPHEMRLRPMRKELTMKKGLVLLARQTYHKANDRLLSILKDTEWDYELKCHPVSDINHYSKIAEKNHWRIVPSQETVSYCLAAADYDFAIAVNTTAYYEALMRGIPCLRFCDGSFTLQHGIESDAFSSLSEYMEAMTTLMSTIQTDEYQQQVDNILQYVMGVGIDNYRTILCRIF